MILTCRLAFMRKAHGGKAAPIQKESVMDRTVDQYQKASEVIDILTTLREGYLKATTNHAALVYNNLLNEEWAVLDWNISDAVLERSYEAAKEEDEAFSEMLQKWDEAITEDEDRQRAKETKAKYMLRVAEVFSNAGVAAMAVPKGEWYSLSMYNQAHNPDSVQAEFNFSFYSGAPNDRLAAIRAAFFKGVWKREAKAPSYEGGKPYTIYSWEDADLGIKVKITNYALAASCHVTYNETVVEEEVEEILTPAITRKVMKNVIKRTPVVVCED
jgi:hypothetical protein